MTVSSVWLEDWKNRFFAIIKLSAMRIKITFNRGELYASEKDIRKHKDAPR